MMLLFLLLFPTLCFADTYFYRVSVQVKDIESAKTSVEPLESKDNGQPFSKTNVLKAPDTNYFLISLTPKEAKDPKAEETSGMNLYQVKYVDEDGNWRDRLDNSAIFPVNKNWAVKTSS